MGLSVCLFHGIVCLFISWDCLSVYFMGLSVYLFHGNVCLFISWDCLSVYFMGLSVCLFHGLFVCLFHGIVCLFISWDCLSVYFMDSLSIYFRLLLTEKVGGVCRDDTVEGLRFFPNLFLTKTS